MKFDMPKAAALYATKYWHVFPVVANTKTPLTSNGYKDASTDPTQIVEWWAKTPAANIGLACAPSGVIALDFDPAKMDDDARALLAVLLEDYPTATQTTPTDGTHLVYELSPVGVATLTNSRGDLPPGVDVRVNGYILLAPSGVTYHGDEAIAKGVVDGHAGRYAWMDGRKPTQFPPQPLPEHILAILKTKPGRPLGPTTEPKPTPIYTNGYDSSNGVTPYAQAALDRELDRLARATEGERNETLNRVAFSLGQLVAGGALPEMEVVQKVGDVALAIGLEEHETARTIASGMKAGAQSARGVPETPRLRFGTDEKVTFVETPPEATPEAVTTGWQLRTLADAYQSRPPIQYLVDGLLPAPSLSIVYGGPGSLKSMLLADLAICIASGQRWLEPLPGIITTQPALTISQAPALWIDFDNGIRRTDERMEAFGRARGLPSDVPLHYVSMPRPWLDVSLFPMLVDLAHLIRDIGAKFIAIDNLGLITGDIEENSAGMARAMGNLRWLCEETESALLVVHHQRKSSVGDKGVRKGESLRGHSSIEASLDLALLIERKEGEDKVAIIPTKVRGYRQFDILGAMFAYRHREGTTDLETARFWAEEMASVEERENINIRSHIKAALRVHGPMAQRDLVNEVRDALAALPGGRAPGINKVRGTIKSMEADGIVQSASYSGKITYALL